MKKTLIAIAALIVVAGGAFFIWDRAGHGTGHGHGDDTHAAAAEHGPAGLNFTHSSERTELFVEFPQLIVGELSGFAVHLTRLANFKPVDQGRVTVALLAGDGKVLESFSADAPTVPGIFRPVVKPTQTGKWRLTIQVEADDLRATHDLGEIAVYPSKESAAKAAAAESVEVKSGISFSKEQQWQTDFALTPAVRRTLRDSVAATGAIRAEANGEALLNAASAGHVAANGAFPRVGMKVEKGQVLALLVPRLGGDMDLATLEASARQARVRFDQTRRERERMESLFSQEAVAEKRVQAAMTEEKLAQAQLDASERRLGQYGGKGGGIPVRAPIAGLVGEVKVAPGAFVNDGQTLFHIVNTGRLWLEARIPESEVGRVVKPSGAWFRIDGFDRTFEIVDGKNGKLVAFSGVVDAATRTVPMIFEFTNPDALLRVGMAARVQVVGGKTTDAVALPYSAVIDENGQSAVFVQKAGESFERRIVQLGIRDGDWVEVRSGVAVGERVVSRGAYGVKLASTAPAVAGHGHAH